MPISSMPLHKFLIWISIIFTPSFGKNYYPCDSSIYCHGNLLDVVQKAGIFNDSKTFVDRKLLFATDVVLEKFRNLMKTSSGNPSRELVQTFIDENFSNVDSEFEPWSPSDWKSKPEFLDRIEDLDLRSWTLEVHTLWLKLGRKLKPEIGKDDDRSTMLHVPNPVIVPGGRFREFYYWDTYWIVQGLLLSGMTKTAKGMIENLLYLVKKYGFVPNGGRKYFLARSQPPYLISMVHMYFKATQDLKFIRKHILTLDKEFEFWENNRRMDIKIGNMKYSLYRYAVPTNTPRPESYKEDVHLVMSLRTDEERKRLYSNIHSACESAWDFSSRWIIKDGENKGDLRDLATQDIIPVDLNSLMCRNAKLMSQFHKAVKDETKRNTYDAHHNVLKKSLKDVFWSEEDGIWFDYDTINSKLRKHFYMSNFIPLWSECFDEEDESDLVVDKVIQYLKSSQIFRFHGGVPASLTVSSQQWDFPEGWAPLQQTLIEGLSSQRSLEAKEIAFQLAQKWISNNYHLYVKYGTMFEKYDVMKNDLGSGGEYDVQTGFGWTNGVALYLMKKYGSRITVLRPQTSRVLNNVLYFMIVLLFFIIFRFSHTSRETIRNVFRKLSEKLRILRIKMKYRSIQSSVPEVQCLSKTV